MGVRLDSSLSTRRSSSSKGGSPERSTLNGSVFTRNPTARRARGSLAIRDRETNDDVVLSGVPREQNVKCGHERHEQRRALALPDVTKLLHELGGDQHGHGRAGGT